MWKIADLADDQYRYFDSLYSKIPRDMLLELLLEPKRNRGSFTAGFFIMN